MGNLAKRIDDLEKRGIHIEWVSTQVDNAQLQQRVSEWLESGGPERAIQEHDPLGLRLLELLNLAKQRSWYVMTLLGKRIEKLEDSVTPSPQENGEMTGEDLLRLLPPGAKEALDRLSFEDLDALSEGKDDEVSAEGRIIVAEIGRLFDEQYGEAD